MPEIISRAAWGARARRSCETQDALAHSLILHHTVGAIYGGDAGARELQRFHQDDRGWCDAAYSFILDPADNTIRELRGFGVRPGSQKNFWSGGVMVRDNNKGTRSIVVNGDYRTKTVTAGNIEALAQLVAEGAKRGDWPAQFTHGHRTYRDQSTTCPGDNLMNAIPAINTRVTELLEDPSMKPPSWATLATQWHIDRGIYTQATPDDVDESSEFHRQTVFRHRFYTAIQGEFGADGVSEAEVKELIASAELRVP